MTAARSDHRSTWKLAAALCVFHMRQSMWADWIAIETIGLASARSIGDRYGEAWLLSGLAIAYMQIGKYGEGLDLQWAFLIVFVFYLLVAALLGFIGYRKVQKVRGPEKAIAEAQNIKAALTSRGSESPHPELTAKGPTEIGSGT